MRIQGCGEGQVSSPSRGSQLVSPITYTILGCLSACTSMGIITIFCIADGAVGQCSFMKPKAFQVKRLACASTPRMNGSLQGPTGHMQQVGKEKPDTCKPFAFWEETQANPLLQISGAVTYRERGAKGLYGGCKLLLQSSSKGWAHIHDIRVPAERQINLSNLIGSCLDSTSPTRNRISAAIPCSLPHVSL
jgi:hypothetical protein